MQDPELEAQELVARFLTASAPLESYLQQRGQLTEIQVQSLAITLKNLEMFFDIWKRKQGLTGTWGGNPVMPRSSSLDET